MLNVDVETEYVQVACGGGVGADGDVEQAARVTERTISADPSVRTSPPGGR
jgi:hypothetical protein